MTGTVEPSQPAWSRQDGFAYRFDWGPAGLAALGSEAGVVVVVDVLRFGTTVDVALARGAVVEPCDPDVVDRIGDADAAPSERIGLSPSVLAPVLHGVRCRLASANGARLALAAGTVGVPVLAACLRNATAVAGAARQLAAGRPIVVLAAGERWADGTVRPCVEDLLGAGAVLHALDPSGSRSAPGCSPEAAAVRAAFGWERFRLREALEACASARELVERRCADDLRWAGALDVSEVVPTLVDGVFRPR